MKTVLCFLYGVLAGASPVWSQEIKPYISLTEVNQAATGAMVVNSVAFSQDGKIFASGGADQNIHVWEAATGKKLAVLTGHTRSIHAIRFAPDGRTLLSASADGTVKLWDIITKKNTRTLRASSSDLFALSISPNGKTVAAGGADRWIDLWEMGTLRRIAGFDDTFVVSLAFSPDGKRLVSGNNKGAIRVWDISTGKAIHYLKSNRDGSLIYSVGFSSDGRELACTGGDDKLAAFWNIDTRKLSGTLALPVPGIYSYSLAFSAQGEILAVGTVADPNEADNVIYLFKTTGEQKKLVATLRGHTGFVSEVAFSPDSKTLASAGCDGTIRLWDISKFVRNGK